MKFKLSLENLNSMYALPLHDQPLQDKVNLALPDN